MERRIAAWLDRQPKPPAPAPVLVTTPVVDDRWLTYTQAVRETKMSRRTIQQMVVNGELDTRRTLRGHVQIRAGSLWQSGNPPCRVMPDSCRVLGRWVVGFCG